MTIFKLFSGLLITLFFLFNFSLREKCKEANLFLRKTEGFYHGTKRGNVKPRNHQICSMNR